MNSKTLSMSGRNSLGQTKQPVEVPASKIGKNALESFKATTNLNKALLEQKSQSKGKQVLANSARQLLKEVRTIKQMQKLLPQRDENEDLEAEVAALNNYKPPPPREHSKQLVDKIIMSRRSKHIQNLKNFQQDIEEYMTSVKDIYSSVKSEAEQFMKLNGSDVREYIDRLTEDALLKKQKEIIGQIQTEIQENQEKRINKIKSVTNNLNSFEVDRTNKINQYCANLKANLIESAFVLEDEAQKITTQLKNNLLSRQAVQAQGNQRFLASLREQQAKDFENMKKQLMEKQNKWKQLKFDEALKTFERDMSTAEYNNPPSRKRIYENIKVHQVKVHKQRQQLIEQLVNADASTYTKDRVDKWLDALRTKNQESNSQIDKYVSQLVKEGQQTKNKSEQRLNKLRDRLNYIGLHNPEENQKVINEKALPIFQQNVDDAKKLLSDATGYIEKYDGHENEICQNFGKFLTKLAQKNDESKKAVDATNQSYEMSKAKLFDQDEQKVEKLNEQFNNLKKQLKESLHHIKLDEMEKKCFDKIDELEQQYRDTHEKNKKLASEHPTLIEKNVQKSEAETAEIFQLYDVSRKAQLAQRNKKEAEERVLKKIEQEEKKKAEEEARQAQQTKKKTGKAPPAPKPKDPKKAAAELQERKQALLKQMGVPQIKQFKSSTGKTWLVFQPVEEIIKSFYKFEDDKPLEDGEQPNPLDYVAPALKDCEGIAVVSQQNILKEDYIAQKVTELRDKVFRNINTQKNKSLDQALQDDKEFIENSLETLDGRLKVHYSLKGKLEAEVYVKRASEITSHKKKYERHARTTKQKMDTQTQKFNFLLEKSLQLMKTHNQEQKKTRQQLATGKNLSQLQGLSSRNRQSSQVFALQMKEITNQLSRLSTSDAESLKQKNNEFLKECKEMTAGGEYSKEEIEWYQGMMNQITNQLQQQKQKRAEKLKEIEQYTSKRRQQLVDLFEKEYAVAIEELAAKDCSGRKYGKPKRISQQRLRGQMAKCQQAQQNLNKMIGELKEQLARTHDKPDTMSIRRKLMTLRTCIGRYARHIEALKPDCKCPEMPRVNYSQSRVDTLLAGQPEIQEDQKRKKTELSSVGILSQQTDDKKFTQLIDDIQKSMKEEAQKIYVGDKAKYLTGADKLPDFLRDYIANMKKNAQNFRLNMARQLRGTCQDLCQLSSDLNNVIIFGLMNIFTEKRKQATNPELAAFKQLQKQMDRNKNDNTRKLRPNLSNPACRDELNSVDAGQKKRLKQYRQAINKTRDALLDGQFKTSSAFLTAILNNFEFLILYFDAMYLDQDFIKLPGDESKEKKHLNLKQLMLLKQKGQTFDPNSERNINKKWPGISFNMFDCPGRKYEYVKTVVEETKPDPKKAGKKEAKDPKKQQQQAEQASSGLTKQIPSIKTDRQKEVFQNRNSALQQFKAEFDKELQAFTKEIEQAENSQKTFQSKWNDIVTSLMKAQ